jgi:hypothetical protein
MPPTVPQHPSATDLAAFALGRLGDSSAEWVGQHLQECSACRAAAANVSADTLAGLLRGSTGETPSVAGSIPPASADVSAALRDHPRYRIVRQLGQGGMGVVYQAEHKVMERPVAVKVISRALVDRPDAVERFHREVRAAAKLDHPNIVKAYDAEQAGDLHLLAMEYVEGHSLHDVLAKKGPLPIAHACHYVRQAALGLQHAFEHGMVHRDLKPHNLMLTPKGTVKILDFGLAKLASEQTRPGGGLTQENMVMGTPEYMAPEQAVNTKDADIRADIYALGCTLYCLLTGRPPFTGDNPLAIIVSHSQDAPPPVESLRPEVPSALAALLARLLAKDPAQRPQTPKELADELGRFMKSSAERGPNITQATAPPPLPRTAPRRYWWAGWSAIVAGLVLAAAIAGIVLTWKTTAGVVTLVVEPADAKVEVSEGAITIKPHGDGEPWRIELAGEKGKLKISKAGFEVTTRDVTVRDKGTTLAVKLEPAVPGTAAQDGFQPGNVWKGESVQVTNGKDKRVFPVTITIRSRDGKNFSAHIDTDLGSDGRILREVRGTVEGGVIRCLGKDAKATWLDQHHNVYREDSEGKADWEGNLSGDSVELRANWTGNGNSYSSVAKLWLEKK